MLLVFGFSGNLWAITPAEEIEIGRGVHMEISQQGAIFTDPYVNQYFQKVADRVANAAGKKPYPIHFYIVYANTLNAFAVPGGYIYFHTETLNSLENEGQLAAILAHEIAHLTSRHFALRAEKAATTNILSLAGLIAGALLLSQGGSNAAALGQAALLGSAGASMQAMLANSRADEADADRKGRIYMIQAGYNPRDMFGAFKIMNEKSFSISSKIPTYLSSHPDIPSRLASTFSDLASFPPAPPDPVYLGIRDRVLAITATVDRARNLFLLRLKENPQDASALHGLGIVFQRNSNFTQAKKYFSEAIALSPKNSEYLSDMGDLLFTSAKFEEALKYYSQSIQVGDRTPQTYLGQARTYEILGKNKEATQAYNAAIKAAGDRYPMALEMAGIFFTKNNSPAKGHFYLGQYFFLIGKGKEAEFHFQETLKSQGGQTYQKEINSYLELLHPKKDKEPPAPSSDPESNPKDTSPTQKKTTRGRR